MTGPPAPTPDLDGFRDAAVRIRAKLGKNVPFFTPIAGTYPPGTSLDPETGKPFDPTIPVAGSGVTTQTFKVGVYLDPEQTTGDNVESNALGLFEEADVILDVAPEDFHDNGLEDATEVEIYGERYEITDWDGDGVGGVEHRVLVQLRKK